MKVCSKCKEPKPLDAFSPSGRAGKGYLNSWCKRCLCAHQAERWKAGAPERERRELEKRAEREAALHLPRACRCCEQVKEPDQYRGNRSMCYACELEIRKEEQRADPEKIPGLCSRISAQSP